MQFHENVFYQVLVLLWGQAYRKSLASTFLLFAESFSNPKSGEWLHRQNKNGLVRVVENS